MSDVGDLDTPEACIVLYARGMVGLADGDNEAALADFLRYGVQRRRVAHRQ